MSKRANDEVLVCDRLRRLRKRINMTANEVATAANLDYQQVLRLESEVSFPDNQIIKEGCNGSVYVLLRLLLFYSSRVSLDEIFNLQIPFHEILIDHVDADEVKRQIMKEKFKNLTKVLEDMNEFIK